MTKIKDKFDLDLLTGNSLQDLPSATGIFLNDVKIRELIGIFVDIEGNYLNLDSIN
ncbi:MAG: hypothetical protein ACFB2X_03565 [Rivularia sp. (in: cyanobacteria)]